MSEVTLTIRVKVKVLGLKDFFESEEKAATMVGQALSTNERIEVLEVRTNSVKADGPPPRLEHDSYNR